MPLMSQTDQTTLLKSSPSHGTLLFCYCSSLIDILKSKKKKLFCTFVDFEKAFDKVWRSAKWHKVLSYNINGKIFKVILNMYENIKSRTSFQGQISDYFSCNNGLRQGENLSPFLFAIYLK